MVVFDEPRNDPGKVHRVWEFPALDAAQRRLLKANLPRECLALNVEFLLIGRYDLSKVRHDQGHRLIGFSLALCSKYHPPIKATAPLSTHSAIIQPFISDRLSAHLRAPQVRPFQ